MRIGLNVVQALNIPFPLRTVALSMVDQAAKPLARPVRVSFNYRVPICSSYPSLCQREKKGKRKKKIGVLWRLLCNFFSVGGVYMDF